MVRRVLFLLFVSVTGLSACTTTRVGDLTMASTKNLGYAYRPVRANVSGQDCAQNILGIPWGSLYPSLEEALDRAVGQVAGGDMMVNAVAHRELLITLLYNRDCISVDGDVVRTGQ